MPGKLNPTSNTSLNTIGNATRIDKPLYNTGFFRKSGGRTWSVFSLIQSIGGGIRTTFNSLLISPLVSVGNKITAFAKKILFCSESSNENVYNEEEEGEVLRNKMNIGRPLNTPPLPHLESPFSKLSPPQASQDSPISSTSRATPPSLPSPPSPNVSFVALDQPKNSSSAEPSTSSPSATPIPLKSEQPDPRFTIKIPALGNCLYCAVYVGLKILYNTDVEITSKLNDSIDPNQLYNEDLTDLTEMLKLPAQNLRMIATKAIEQQLQDLEKNKDISDYLEQNANILPNIDNSLQQNAIPFSTMIQNLKHTVDDHNQSLNTKIEDDLDSFRKNRERYQNNMLELENLLPLILHYDANTSDEESYRLKTDIENNILELNRLRASENETSLARNIDAIISHSQKRINCSVNGFKASEIPELLRYVNEFMKEDMNYANTSEIIELSNFFQVPIVVEPEYGDPIVFNEQLLFDRKPIVLQLIRRHYNLKIDLDHS